MICDEFVGEVSIEGKPGIEALHFPFRGSMVGSPDPFHGVPAPFEPSLEWEFLRCPYGRTHKPFVLEDVVKTHKGMVRLPRDGSQAFLDPDAPTEVGRESISDRVEQISDAEAERLVRGALEKPKVDEKSFAFVCPACGKTFDKKNQLTGHMIAHKRGK